MQIAKTKTQTAAAQSAARYLVVVVLFAGCGGDPASTADTTTAGTAPSSTSGTELATPAREVNQDHPVVRIETSQGPITLRLDAVNAPGTVRNFLNCASEGFYDNTLVHYVDPGKMILAGGYAADRQPKPPRLAIRNEADNGLKNVRGTIAMTRDPAQVDSATTQFFINLADAPQRDHQGDSPDQFGYCVFGEVTEGLEVAERISNSATANLSGDLVQTPEPAVVISAVRVVQ